MQIPGEARGDSFFRNHICQILCTFVCINIWLIPIGYAEIGSRFYIHTLSGECTVSIFGKNLSLLTDRKILNMISIALFFNIHISADCQWNIITARPILGSESVFLRQLLYFIFFRHLLIRPVLVKIVIGIAPIAKHCGSSGSRQIKHRKTASCDQQCDYQKVVDRLFCLKLHHSTGNDIFIRIFLIPSPTVYHRVKHRHIKAC